MSAIEGGPDLIVGVWVASLVHASALGLMEVLEVQGHHHPLHVSFRPPCPIHHKLLRDAHRLNDNVADTHWCVRDCQRVPCQSLIKRVEDFLGELHVVGHDDEAAVVAELVDVGALAYLIPGQTPIPRQIGVHLVRPSLLQLFPHIPYSHYDTQGGVLGVGRREHPIARVDLQMQRAPILNEAMDCVPIRVFLRGLDEFPLPSFIMGDVGLYLFNCVGLFGGALLPGIQGLLLLLILNVRILILQSINHLLLRNLF
mmetsp:Transcript_23888/g.23575  ORF Transcript_23888/g.23575 Transcript_23888/m.23575 type:complete len:256 (+) Transcript_23888:492-1259(+)